MENTWAASRRLSDTPCVPDHEQYAALKIPLKSSVFWDIFECLSYFRAQTMWRNTYANTYADLKSRK